MATVAPPTESPPADDRIREVGLMGRLMVRPEIGAILALILVWIFFAIVAYDNNFISMQTTAAILNRAAPLGILAVAVAMLMIAGEFDLSVGSLIGFGGMAIMILVSPSASGGLAWPLGPAIVVALLITVAAGLLNGILVQTTKLPSFIITLGALFVFRGLATAIPRTMTNRTQLGGFGDIPGADILISIFGSKISFLGGRFDTGILWWIAITAMAVWVLNKTRVGNWIFGVGGDANASRNVGVPVAGLKLCLFMFTALAAFFVALLQVASTGPPTRCAGSSPSSTPSSLRWWAGAAHRGLRIRDRRRRRSSHLRHGPAGSHRHRGRRRLVQGVRRRDPGLAVIFNNYVRQRAQRR